MKRIVLSVAALVSIGAGLAAAQALTITGAGATFPYPIYSTWFVEYSKLHPAVRIQYQAVGSSTGIKQLTAGAVFFGASDGPMSDVELKAAPGAILHFPAVLGGVVPAYNVPRLTADLKFTGALLADIFLGTVKKWNDPAITKVNPGVNLPATDITVVHRSDGSGATYIWVDYLSKVSPVFKSTIGVNASLDGPLSWPVGVGGRGNEGVAGRVTQTPGSIGYVELTYALQNKISYGVVQNAAGEFTKASVASVTAAAAEAAAKMPADFRVSITNAPGKGVYPIASFTWLLVYQNPKDKAQAAAMVEFLKWALTDGQKYCADLGYAPLPSSVVKLELTALAKLTGM